jgi:hypothetical protein
MVFFSSNKYISVMSVQLLNACELKKDILFNFFYNWMQGKKNLSFLLTQTTPFFSAYYKNRTMCVGLVQSRAHHHLIEN